MDEGEVWPASDFQRGSIRFYTGSLFLPSRLFEKRDTFSLGPERCLLDMRDICPICGT